MRLPMRGELCVFLAKAAPAVRGEAVEVASLAAGPASVSSSAINASMETSSALLLLLCRLCARLAASSVLRRKSLSRAALPAPLPGLRGGLWWLPALTGDPLGLYDPSSTKVEPSE